LRFGSLGNIEIEQQNKCCKKQFIHRILSIDND
jgi:hypothetical protein